MKIQKFKLSELKPASYNPRKIKDTELTGLSESLKKFGYLQHVVININSGKPVIIAGHQRVKALEMQGGIDDIDCVVVDFDPITEKAANIALNAETISGDWDIDLLAPILEELKFEFSEFDDLNFDDLAENLDFDLDDSKDSSGEEKKADNIPTIVETPVINNCDLIELGAHRLLCGDSTKVEDIKRLLGGAEWDCLIFDPPFEIADLYGEIPEYGDGQKLVVFWDYRKFGLASFGAISKGWTAQFEFIWDRIISWPNTNRPLARHKACGVFCDDPFFNTDKAIIHDGKKRKAQKVTNARGTLDYKPMDGAKHISTVEIFQNVRAEADHPYVKPMGWVQAIYNGMDCEIFFDMFGGSGSTLIYAEKNNKSSFTMELEPKFCQVIVQRWVDFTENFEVKINGKIVDWRKLLGG